MRADEHADPWGFLTCKGTDGRSVLSVLATARMRMLHWADEAN